MRKTAVLAMSLCSAVAACQTTKTGPEATPSAQTAPVAVASAPAASPPGAQSAPFPWCPLLVTGTKVEAQDTPNGVALVFHTTSDVNAVRDRVRQMADMHNRMASGGGPPMMGRGGLGAPDGGPRAMGMGMGRGAMMGGRGMGRGMGRHAMMASDAQVENTDDGAKLLFSAKSPADIAIVREHTRWRAEHMATGPCAVMDMSEPDAGG